MPPKGPRSPPRLPRPQPPSPLKRQTEVHSRSKSNFAGADSSGTSRARAYSIEPETRYSNPLSSEQDSYQPQYIKPLRINKVGANQGPVKKPEPSSRETIVVSKPGVVPERPYPTRTSSLHPTDTKKVAQRPLLLTDVSDEDLRRRRIHSRGYSLGHIPSTPPIDHRFKVLDLDRVSENPLSSSPIPSSPIPKDSPVSSRKLRGSTLTPTQSIRDIRIASLERRRAAKAQTSGFSPTKPAAPSPRLSLTVPEFKSLFVRKSASSSVRVAEGSPTSRAENNHPGLPQSESNQSTGTILRTVLERIDEETKNWQTPSPQLDARNNPRPHSLYNPDLFATQHGIPPNPSKPALAVKGLKRKPVSSNKVTFALDSSPASGILRTPIKQVSGKTAVQELPSSPPTPSRPVLLEIRPQRPFAVEIIAPLAVSKASHAQPPAQSSKESLPKVLGAEALPDTPEPITPYANRYIEALQSTASASENYRAAAKLKRHQSLAKIKRLTLTPSPLASDQPIKDKFSTPSKLYSFDSNSEARHSLSNWIEDLCNARSPVSPTSPIPTVESPKKAEMDKSVGASRSLARAAHSRTQDRSQDHDRETEDSLSNPDADQDTATTRKEKITPSEELTVMIDDMLSDMQGKFHAVTSEIMAKMDDMGRRIDNMEASLVPEGEHGSGDEDERK